MWKITCVAKSKLDRFFYGLKRKIKHFNKCEFKLRVINTNYKWRYVVCRDLLRIYDKSESGKTNWNTGRNVIYLMLELGFIVFVLSYQGL